jgi:hypothetical protein
MVNKVWGHSGIQGERKTGTVCRAGQLISRALLLFAGLHYWATGAD